jgi:hypothetical protein
MCQDYYGTLKGFDRLGDGYLEKKRFIDIMRDMFPAFSWPEVNQITDFAFVFYTICI